MGQIQEIKNNKLVIVVPIYRSFLEWYEVVSLKQLKMVFGRYPITFCIPESLYFDGNDIFDSYLIERFPDYYFENTKAYSRLMLSEEFYSRFVKYKYMLVYQTDAFVFYDAITKFISMNYDYIGAPLQGFHEHRFKVGNGGLSLRRIDRIITLLGKQKKVLYTTSAGEVFLDAEDLFYSYCGNRKEIDFCTPPVRIANRFSVQWNIAHGIDKILYHGLPMGTHKWHYYNYDIWKPYIESYGYKLPSVDEVNNYSSLQGDYIEINSFFINRFIKKIKKYKKKWEVFDHQDRRCRVYLWGAGKKAGYVIDFLIKNGIKIVGVIDSNADEDFNGFHVIKPDKNIIFADNNSVVIISSTKYEDDIAEKLDSWKLIENVDFYRFDNYCRELFNEYKKRCQGRFQLKTIKL